MFFIIQHLQGLRALFFSAFVWSDNSLFGVMQVTLYLKTACFNSLRFSIQSRHRVPGRISMKGKRIALSCAVMALAAASGATANEIYKWTDENGTVHYGDRPSGAATEQRLAMTYARTDSNAVQQRVQARVDARSAREEARAEAAASQKEAEENAATAAERESKCERSRARLESYLQSQRLYRTDDNGERVYLDDEQRQEARQNAEQQVAEFCS